MKLFSQALELKAIRSIAVRNGFQDERTSTALATNVLAMSSSLLLSAIDESFFNYEPCRAAYKRIIKVAEKRSRILDYSDLLEDPALDEEFRDVLREEKKKGVKSLSEANDLLLELDKYRKLRVMYDSAKTIVNRLKDTKVDPEELIDYAAGRISEARSRENLQDKILSIGHDANAFDLIDKVLDPTTELLHKTGYTEFDTRNGGMPSEGVFILAGTTSGGKSVLRMNLCEYMYRHNNLDTLTVSLEMNAEKEARRLSSSISGVPLWKIAKGVLTEEERTKIKRAWKKFHKHGKENNCRYSLFCPTRGLTIQQLLMLIKPFKYRVVALDYVSLLEGVDEKDQWKALSSIVRQCKIFSSENKCLVFVLAQLDNEDDRIRYSKGMLEHADGCWTWNYSKPEQRELHEVPIQQRKARDQELFPFTLKERFDVMRFENPDTATSTEASKSDDDSEEPTPSKSKKHKSSDRRDKANKRDRVEEEDDDDSQNVKARKKRRNDDEEIEFVVD